MKSRYDENNNYYKRMEKKQDGQETERQMFIYIFIQESYKKKNSSARLEERTNVVLRKRKGNFYFVICYLTPLLAVFSFLRYPVISSSRCLSRTKSSGRRCWQLKG